MEFIDLKRQYTAYRADIDAAIAGVLAHGQYILGPEVARLEGELARFAGAAHCVTCASGTDALLLALMALGIGPGDEVITSPYTFFASAEVIALAGATPVFADVDPVAWCLDPARVAAAITPRTRAVIAVSLYGQPAPIEALEGLCRPRAIAVIEDAAQSFGSARHGRRSGALAGIGCTSFFPAKPLGCYGDGGAVFCRDLAVADRVRALRTHGSLTRHRHEAVGLCSRLDTLQAAVLLAKLPRFADECAARTAAGRRYDALLSPHCAVPGLLPGNTHVYAQYALRVPERDRVAALLQAEGIPVAIHYPTCLHHQPALSHLGLGAGAFPVAEAIARDVLCLPMHPFLGEDEQRRVAAAVVAALAVAAPRARALAATA